MSEDTRKKGYSDGKDGKKPNPAGIWDAKDRQDYIKGHEQGKKN